MASLIAQLVKNLQCRRPWFDFWVGKIPWRRDRLPTLVFLGLPFGSAGKESACNAGDLVQSLGWKIPGEGNNYPLQFSGLENSMDHIVHGVTNSQTQLSNCFLHSSPAPQFESNNINKKTERLRKLNFDHWFWSWKRNCNWSTKLNAQIVSPSPPKVNSLLRGHPELQCSNVWQREVFLSNICGGQRSI